MATMTAYAAETLIMAEERTRKLAAEVLVEVDRLLRSGAVDPDDHNRGLLFGVAIENIADRWLGNTERKSKAYRNLKCF